MLNDLHTKFLQPDNTYRSLPFWCWNGELDIDELKYQIDVMKKMGFKGFFIHSRTGLSTEYLGDRWFELVNECADYADSIGLETWLYDEDRWPSGTAGGMVTENPSFRRRFIRMSVSAVLPTDTDIVAYEANADGYFVFTLEEMGANEFYNGYTYADLMNPAAVRQFFKITHDKYAERCGDRLGKSIKGIFTDEAHRGSALDGFDMVNKDPKYLAPYTDGLFERFESEYGYSLKNNLSALFLKSDKPFCKIKYDYMKLLQQLFTEGFVIPYQQWCEQHNLLFTGHFLDETTLASQCSMAGSIMSLLPYMHIPGIDYLTEYTKHFWIAKQLQSVGAQTGKDLLISELYGCTGWQMSFYNYKCVSDWQQILGVNLRCQHLAWYSMLGEAKRDFPASYGCQSAWWNKHRHFEDYAARLSTALSMGKRICKVGIISPIESIWGMIYSGWANSLQPADEYVCTLEDEFRALFGWMNEIGVDFDYIDETILSRFGSIDKAFTVGEAAYDCVIVPPMAHIRKSTYALLEAFSQSGGKVVFMRYIPKYIDGKADSSAKDLCLSSAFLPFDRTALAAYLNANICRDFAIKSESDHELLSHVRILNDGEKIYAFLNTNRLDKVAVTLELFGVGAVEKWDCMDGGRKHIACKSGDNGVIIEYVFSPGEELILTSSDGKTACYAPFATVQLNDIVTGAYSLSEFNVMPLDIGEYAIDCQWLGTDEVLKIDRKVRSEFNLAMRGGTMVQPWFAKKYHSIPEDVCSVDIRYQIEVSDICDTVYLAVEEFDVKTILLNGEVVNDITDIRWVDACYTVLRLPAMLKGTNILTVSQKYNALSNIECLFLLGGFGVNVNGDKLRMTKLPDTLTTDSLLEQGLPFYSGDVIYHTSLDAANGARIHTGAYDGACVTVRAGDAEYPAFWAPFECDVRPTTSSVDVVLTPTRRNTFGPLHEIPVINWAYGPHSFITEGESFSYDYTLIPSGFRQN